jgi:photosystem II stability/assembly factor-like uncharacterized protein
LPLSRTLLIISVIAVVAAATCATPGAQSPRTGSIDPALFAEMAWRNIGPYRAGRTKSAAGHPSQPYTFYIGVCNGGVWKTTDAGRTWTPIFDGQSTGSIGSVVVAPSDPNVLYVGSGEGLGRPDLSVGDGVYRSRDAGRTWTHLGLRDGQQIPNIAVDPGNANRLFVAVAGHPYGPNEERGIFRSTDGGQSFEKVLFKDVNTGGNDVDIDPVNPNIVYATLWEERQGPWENGQWRGTGGGIYKSSDGGSTWKPLTNGLPQNGALTQANLAIASSDPKRVYAAVAVNAVTSFYRSDDAGETWTQITQDPRPVGRIGGGDLAVPIVNPKNADIVINASTVAYKSTDGGRSWAPAGLDAQRLREQIARARLQAAGAAVTPLEKLHNEAEALAGEAGSASLSGAGAALLGVMNTLQGADAQPTALQVTAIETALRNARAALARWRSLRLGSDLYFPSLQN